MLQPKVKWALGVLWVVAWSVIATLMLRPLAAPVPPGADLVVHFLVFAVMACGAVGFSRRPGQLALLACATLAAGTALELAQHLLPYRTFQLADLVANGIGAAVGYGAALLVLNFVLRPAEVATPGAPS